MFNAPRNISEYTYPSTLPPIVLHNLQEKGYIPHKNPVFSSSAIYCLQHKGPETSVAVFSGTMKSEPAISQEAKRVDDGDPVVRFVCAYKNRTLDRIVVVYHDGGMVDMTPYVADTDSNSFPIRWNAFLQNNTSTRLHTAIDMLYIYGPEKFHDVMAAPTAVKYASLVFVGGMVEARSALMNILQATKPDVKTLGTLLDVLHRVNRSELQKPVLDPRASSIQGISHKMLDLSEGCGSLEGSAKYFMCDSFYGGAVLHTVCCFLPIAATRRNVAQKASPLIARAVCRSV